MAVVYTRSPTVVQRVALGELLHFGDGLRECQGVCRTHLPDRMGYVEVAGVKVDVGQGFHCL